MNRTLLVFLWLFATACAHSAASPPARDRVLTEWRFSRGLAGWAPGATAKTRIEKGALVVATNANDPMLIGPEVRIDARDGDVLEVRMSASRAGEIQWFWRRTKEGPYGGFSAERQRTVPIVKDASMRTYRAPVLWATPAAGEGNREPFGSPITGLRFDLPEGAPGVYRIDSIRIVRPVAGSPSPANWSYERRVPVATPRIDIARQVPPTTAAVRSNYTVAMWYFAAWEPEYTWDGWKQVAERSPWRIPLLYDSSDSAMEFNGIRYYRSSNPRAIDWHVHWMREHTVNLMLWDWYPQTRSNGEFDPTFFGNRALELGFLGKSTLGGPPPTTNRFADKIEFATMWTNHAPGNRVSPGLTEYLVDQFFRQPNYYNIDGKPLLPIWSAKDLIDGVGGKPQARQALDRLRAYARTRGFPGVYVAIVNGVETRAQAAELGVDGVMGYNYLNTGGFSSRQRRVGSAVIEDRSEDFQTQTIRGQRAKWEELSREFGRDYLVATTPMQNWEPTLRPYSFQIENQTPTAYGEMLRSAKALIEARRLRRFVSVEAFNEWLEGSYFEPSTQWGFGYLEALRDAFAAP
jgi:hypothetical protein